MSIHDTRSAKRPVPDQPLVDIADYVIDYVIDRRADGQQSDRIYTKRLRRRRDVAVSKQLTGMEQMWSEKARANYDRARQLADEARGLAK